MYGKGILISLAFFFSLPVLYSQQTGHEIIFCGESIPVSEQFVGNKLMNIIRQQTRYVNMAQLRKKTDKYFSIVEGYLRAAGLPEDFKYLPIVESGFTTAVSKVGATGFWQIMPETAKDWGLVMNDNIDERNDIYKSTQAACKELARNYLFIKKKHGISSWVLAAAAYNNGIGNIDKAIKRQGNNYFQMKLNAETAAYVYKIIAIKELFEYPEIYIKNFGYNVFNTEATKPLNEQDESNDPTFASMTLEVNENDGNHPEHLDTSTVFDKKTIRNYVSQKQINYGRITFVSAKVIGKYSDFKDGDLVSFELHENLQVGNNFVRKGTIMQWQGWIIDDRVYIDLGFGRNVIMYDLRSNHGLSLSSLKKKKVVIIMVNDT